MIGERVLDIVREVVNIGIGDAASAFSSLIGGRVVITVPEIRILDARDIPGYFRETVPGPGVCVTQDFKGSFRGRTLLYHTEESRAPLLECMTGEAGAADAPAETQAAVLEELGNIVMVSCVSTLADVLDDTAGFQLPDVALGPPRGYFRSLARGFDAPDRTVVGRSPMIARDGRIAGEFFIMLSFDGFMSLVEKMKDEQDRRSTGTAVRPTERATLQEEPMSDDLTLDIIREVINIGVGDAAAALSALVRSRVWIKTPDVHVIDSKDVPAFIRKEIRKLGVYISQDFKGGIRGKTLLFYSRESCNSLIKTLLQKDFVTVAMTDTAVATLQEIGNIIMVSCISTISDLIEDSFSFEIPDVTIEISEGYFQNIVEELGELDRTIVVRNQMVVKDKKIEGYIFLLLGFDDFLMVIRKMHDRITR